MKTFTTIIKENFPPLLSAPLLAVSSILGSTLLFPLESYMTPAIKDQFSKIPQSRLLAAIVLTVTLLSFFYVRLYLKFRDKLIPKFGVKWDRNKEMYCPACDKSLSRIFTTEKMLLSCDNCNRNLNLITDKGKEITIDEAKKLFVHSIFQ